MILASRFLRLRWRQKGVFGLAYNVLFTRHLLVSRSAAADDDWLQDSSFGSFSVRSRWLVCALSARPTTTKLPSPARGRRGVFAIISRRRTHWRSLDSMMIKRNIYCLMLMAFLNLEHAYNKVRHQFSLLFKLAIHFSRLAMDTETCTLSVGGAALIPAFVVVTNEIPLTFATSH